MIFFVFFLFPAVLANTFWMTAELLNVEWREGCLTTASCSQARFMISENMLSINEKQSISWPVSEDFEKKGAHGLETRWLSGNPDQVSLSCQVVGTDPTYGFPRICDQTAAIRVFQNEVADAFSRLRRHQTTTPPVPEEELGKRIIEVRGKCFNASLAVRKHTERCPTCPDPSEMNIIGQELAEDPSIYASSIFAQLQGEDNLMHIGMLVLAGIAVATSAAFGCVLVAYLRQKKTSRQVSVKPRYHPYSPALVKSNDDESRYDMPWGENHRNLGYWQTKSDTTTSPIDSSSSLGTKFNYRTTTVIPPPQTRMYHHISPNSSLGAHDSGLESV